MTILIASWNVNSVRARITHLQDFLTEKSPDIVFLQEIKGETLPDISEDYTAFFKGQKSYNGVCTLVRKDLQAELILDTLPGDSTDEQARYLEIDWEGIRLINIYLPNGNPVGTEKFTYKLSWMKRLHNHLNTLRESEIPFLVGGDFNVIPEGRDCYNPALWAEDALFHKETRKLWRGLVGLGLYDAYRILHPDESGAYTFWDYQAGAWPKNLGLRIDHFLLSPTLTDRLTSCEIDKAPRALEKASDHTPILIGIDWP